MLSPETLSQSQHVMTVCNACRYCEAYCPVFQAMENRTSFAKGDILYLSNLCHNCGECLYACQYAPPHEFGINVPRVLAEARVESYEEFCWPAMMRPIFRRNARVIAWIVGSLFLAWVLRNLVQSWDPHGDFYAVMPHDDMVMLFGVTGMAMLVPIVVGVIRAVRAFGPAGGYRLHGLRDVLTLRHLHGSGEDCTSDIDVRTPWRRYFHHCTFYGFTLCTASTTVAAIYHLVGWRAPYALLSAPVILGTLGGVGLIVGPLGLLAQWRGRDTNLRDKSQSKMDVSFILMLVLTSATGLLLLALRGQPSMPALLVVHLGFVLALFTTLPYGKFVHGIYRTIALLKFAGEAHR